MSVSPPHPPPARRWWRRWIADPVVQQLTQGVDPRRIALTLAVGSALALFPILGTTTLLCFLAGLILGLNQPIIQAINAAANIVWVPALFACIRLGDHLAGARSAGLDLPEMAALFHRDPAQAFRRFGAVGLHAMLGWAAVAPIWIPLVYGSALPLLRAAARGRRIAPARH